MKNNESLDWEHLKKSLESKPDNLNFRLDEDNYDYKDSQLVSEDFVKYNELTDQIIDDEDEMISFHMDIIKDDAKLLTEEGKLISNIKGVGGDDDFHMEEYTKRLDQIIHRKISLYMDLKKKMETYKLHCREEDDLRNKINPKLFI